MRRTERGEASGSERLAVDTAGLKEMLCCGRDTAIRIGDEASARITVGKRVLWNVARVQAYLDRLSGKQDQDEGDSRVGDVYAKGR